MAFVSSSWTKKEHIHSRRRITQQTKGEEWGMGGGAFNSDPSCAENARVNLTRNSSLRYRGGEDTNRMSIWDETL